MATLTRILDQHLDNASSLIEIRCKRVLFSGVRLSELESIDRKIVANLEGIRLSAAMSSRCDERTWRVEFWGRVVCLHNALRDGGGLAVLFCFGSHGSEQRLGICRGVLLAKPSRQKHMVRIPWQYFRPALSIDA